MNAECSSKAQPLSSNIISTLPQSLIENILCLIPIKEAARTSILSREWKYKWTTIPKLEFYAVSKITTEENEMDHECKLLNAICQVLLMRQGPIHEFTFSTFFTHSNCHELDQILFHLSRNHAVKKLRLEFSFKHYKLPLCAYSLHQLTNLYLRDIDLNHQPTSIRFGNLRSLSLANVRIRTKALIHLLSNCPSLESFSMFPDGDIGSKDCTIIELFECLPMIKHMLIWGYYIQPWLVLDSVPRELPTSLNHLKYFCFYKMCFTDNHGLTFLAALIKCSPNLEKIELEIDMEHYGCYGHQTCCYKLKEYSDVRLEHLKELEIRFFSSFKREMLFVEFILARSPKLKKVSILGLVEEEAQESDMLEALSQAPRASPVQIVVKKWDWDGYSDSDDEDL